MKSSKPIYVIVVDKNIYSIEDQSQHIRGFIKSLETSGIVCRIEEGQLKNNVYIMLYFSREALVYFASFYEIDINDGGHSFVPFSPLTFRTVQTPFSNTRYKFERSNVDELTSMEQILIVTEVLNDIIFDPNDNSMQGLTKLTKLGGVLAAYPLHDGPYQYSSTETDDNLNDRQLLAKYWSNFGVWYKEQPLNLIHKYYGTEIAFYFAWLGFYNKMLLSAALMGLCSFTLSLLHLLASENVRVSDICNSNITLCPICYSHDDCIFPKLSASCLYAHLSILFDNRYTIVFAIFMSFWATVFMNRWKTYETVLKLRWNVTLIDEDTTLRPKFREKVKHQRISEITGKMEPYVPPVISVTYTTITYATCSLLEMVLTALLGVIFYRMSMAGLSRLISKELNLNINMSFLTLSTSSLIQVCFVKLFGKFYSPLSIWLTELEHPRTQSEFDKSVIYKRFFLAFANNYSSLFYISFFKGLFYFPFQQTTIFGIRNDVCSVCGCIIALCIQLCFLIVFRGLIGNIITLIQPLICKIFKKQIAEEELEQHEEEFNMIPTERYILVKEFMEMIIQYGFVTFFVAAFPLVPICALINNVLELRLDATKFVKRFRRCIPRRESGLEAWNSILTFLTHASIATNAFVLAFTGDFVLRLSRGVGEGFVMSTLSEFNVLDHTSHLEATKIMAQNENNSICYYRGNRYPPHHPNKYELTTEHWYQFGLRLLAVIIFEHVIIALNGSLSLFLPEMPFVVRQFLIEKRTQENDKKLELVKKEYNRSTQNDSI